MLESKKNLRNPKLDDLSNFKNLMSLNDSLFEATKTAIKAKNNDIAFKMMENLGDRPELWHEYLTVAIIHQNFGFAKQLIDKYVLEVKQNPSINASTINSEIFNETLMGKFSKTTENKENYLTIECPLIIQAAIGGDLDIFKLFVDRGADINSYGHFTLSRKNKNSVISNVLGTASFYGRVQLVHFILEKYRVDVNYKCLEKKSKIKQFSLNKEFTEFTPIHLAVVSDTNEYDSIEILKLVRHYGANFNLTDFNKNNILHLASKFNKLNIIKFLVEEFKFVNMINDLNKEGQTAVAVAQESSNVEIVDYLLSISNIDQENKIEDDINDLLEMTPTKNKKGKKNKKKKDAKDDLIVGSEWQEVLKVPKPKNKLTFDDKIESSTPSPATLIESKTINKNKINESKHDEDNYYEDANLENENYDDAYNNVNSAKTYERKSYSNDKNYNYNYDRGNYSRDYDYYNYNYTKSFQSKNEAANYNSNYYNKNYTKKYYNKEDNLNWKDKNINENINAGINENVGEVSKSIVENDLNSNITTENTLVTNVPINKNKSSLIGLGTLTKLNKNKKKDKEKEKKENIQQVENNLVVEKENEPLYNERSTNILSNIDNLNSEINTENFEKALVNEIQHNYKSDNSKQDQDNEEYINEEEDFLQEEPIIETQDKQSKEYSETKIEEPQIVQVSNNPELEMPQQQPQAHQEGIKEITSKYLDLEKQYEKEKQKKFEMENYINSQKSHLNSSLKKIHVVNNTEDNILDLLSIANEELERKSKIIYDLQSRIEYLEGKSLERLHENELNQLSNFYNSK